MNCTGTAYIYRTFGGEYVGSEVYCEGEDDCTEGSKCKEIKDSFKVGNFTIETKYCQCKTGDVNPLPPQRCHVEVVILRAGEKVIYANALCFGGGCPKPEICKRVTMHYPEVLKDGRDVEVERTVCECGLIPD